MSRRHGHLTLIPPPKVKRPAMDAGVYLAAAELLHREGQLQAALKGYRVIMERFAPSRSCSACRPDLGRLCPQHVLGVRAAFLTSLCAFQMRLYGEAILLMDEVRFWCKNLVDVHYNLGIFLHAVGDVAAAADCYRMALALKPDHAAAENNLGNALRELGDVETATLCFDRLLSRDPQDPEARYNLSYITLLHGLFERGFALYESRWDCAGWKSEYGRKDVTSPRLERADAPPCRVFVFQEQGIGDTLQFMRYLPLLLDHGHSVIFEAPIELADWLQVFNQPGFTVIKRGEPIPEHDAHVPLLTLAPLLGTKTEADIPPILRPDVRIPASTPMVRDLHDRDHRALVGICWAGNAKHHNDRHRSTTVDQLAPLFARPNTRFVSLQIGSRGVDLLAAAPSLALGEGSELLDCSAAMTSFEATAALIQRCDAVVTVDTSIAHLAGTLGVRTLILTSWLSEWRWMLERTDSPWYPSVELVRQPRLGDWPAAAQLARDLLEDLP
jgi:tetratricopeptide (TPR) repeat protein